MKTFKILIWMSTIICLSNGSGTLSGTVYTTGQDYSYLLFTSDNPHTHDTISWYNIRNNDQWKRFNPNNPTVIYVMGWLCKISEPHSTAIRNAYLETTTCNFIAVDWEQLVSHGYLVAVGHAKRVGPNLADLIQHLISLGANQSSIHIIGYSLGAQVAGFAGKALKSRGVTIGRITGLDPAGPGFVLTNKRLSTGDAAFVDIIHTDMYRYGFIIPLGDIDFYPNYNTYLATGLMPGCFMKGLFCSHGRSWEYYAESVRNPIGFPAVSKTGSFCQQVYMGLKAERTSCREYILVTNENSPYARYAR